MVSYTKSAGILKPLSRCKDRIPALVKKTASQAGKISAANGSL